MTIGAEKPTDVTSLPPARNIAITYLKTFITLLVLVHHSVLAYTPCLHKDESFGSWESLIFPVLDLKRYWGFLELVVINDSFFMPAMFFLSGLFSWPSMLRQGGYRYLRSRSKRLLLPYIVNLALSPFTVYPAYFTRTEERSLQDYWSKWISLGYWPSGSGWFIGALFLYDILFTFASSFPYFGRAIEEAHTLSNKRPQIFLFAVCCLATAAYLPLAILYGADGWSLLGPFQIQTSRILFYPLCFLFGMCVGARGINLSYLKKGGDLEGRWNLWLLCSAVNWAVVFGLRDTPHLPLRYLTFVSSSIVYTISLCSLFSRFAVRWSVLDHLSENAYGMYLVHYPIHAWIPLLLLEHDINPAAKGTVTSLIVFFLSWGGATHLRQLPKVQEVL
jgi:hypothetical protein